MTRNYGIVPIVLVTPLLLAVGCVHVPSMVRSESPAMQSLSAEVTPSVQDSSSGVDASALDPVEPDSASEAAYYGDAAASQKPVVVDFEAGRTVEKPSPESNVVQGTQQETEVNSILSAPTVQDDSRSVEFASVAALENLDVAFLKDFVGETSGALLESSEVEQAGCHLFCERPPLRRECVDLGLGTISSVIHPCGMQYIAPYVARVSQFGDSSDDGSMIVPSDTALACPPPAWWEQHVVTPADPAAMPIPLDIESLLIRTLANSKYLQGLADLPLIREKSTMEAIAEFDVSTFMETRFRRPSDPVGNELTVGPGGSRRFRENDFASSAGIARKTSRGGRVQLAQEIGLLNNNSTFIDPRHQGNARLTLNLTQPLLSGAGKTYNTSLIMLAQMDERVAWDEVSAQLQDYLVEVTENYWQLYLERCRFNQKERHLQRGEAILLELEHRREIDAVENQIARARAAVQNRRTTLIRARTQVRNVQSRLRGLVNDPQLYGPAVEMVPAETPYCQPLDITHRDAMAQALESRSEIDEAIQKVRAAGVRLRVAKNELLPILDVVVETYLSGLRGENDIGQAWVDQFSVGEPSYSAGVRYEIPLHNRLAKNRHQRRRLEMRQAISQFEFQVEELMSEVDIAVREVDTAYKEMLSRHEAMVASEIDLQYFEKRWQLLPGDNRTASFLLEDILEAQDRLAAEESNYAQTQVSYAMSVVNLKRALGILLHSERVQTERACECGLPQYSFHKDTAAIMPDETEITPLEMIPPPMDDTKILLPADGGASLQITSPPVVIESLDETLPATSPEYPIEWLPTP